MFCPNCRNQIDGSVEFCPHCGTNIKQIKAQLQNQTRNNVQQVMPQNYNQNISQNLLNNKNGKKFPIIPIIIVLLLVVIAIFGVSKIMKKNTTQPKHNETVNENNTTNNKDADNDTSNNTSGNVDPNTNLTYDKNGAFLMTIEDVFTITGRGTVVTGRVSRGTIKLNDEIQIIGLDKEIITTTVTEIEMFRKQVDYAEAGDNVGLSIKDVSRDEVERGQVIAKPNSIKASKKFEATIDVLSKEEGGRHTPFFTDYRPQFYFRTTDITGVVKLPDDVEMVTPGDKNVQITVELVNNVAMEVGTEFSIREGGRTIASGKVTKVY